MELRTLAWAKHPVPQNPRVRETVLAQGQLLVLHIWPPLPSPPRNSVSQQFLWLNCLAQEQGASILAPKELILKFFTLLYSLEGDQAVLKPEKKNIIKGELKDFPQNC